MAGGATARRPRPAQSASKPARASRAKASWWRWRTLIVLLALMLGIGVPTYLLATRAGSNPTAASGGPGWTLQTADYHSLAFSPDDPNVVFFGHHNGLMQSRDGGQTFSPVVARPNFDAMGLAVSRANSRQLYLAGHELFERSLDGGASWQSVVNDLPGIDIHGFAMSPDDPNHLYALVVMYGLFESTDGGASWRRLDAKIPGDVMAIAAAGGSPETLYAGSMRGGLLTSGDGGTTWLRPGGDQAPRGVIAVAVDPAAPQTLYVGTDSGLYKSTDGGSTWSPLPFPGKNAVALAVSPSRPSVLLAIAVTNRLGLVYRSEDGGATWRGHQ